MKNFLLFFLIIHLLAKAETNSIILKQNQDFKENILNKEIEEFNKWKEGYNKETKEKEIFLKTSENCFFLGEILFEGAVIFSPKTLNSVVKSYLKRNVCGDEVSKIVKTVNQFYIKKGYITSTAYLKPQNLKSGRLIITIIEGRVENVLFQGKSSTNFMLNPIHKGDFLNIKDIDMLTENLNSLSSFKYKTELDAGTSTGMTIINIKGGQGFPLNLEATFDDLGQESTGKNRYSFKLKEENLLNIGEEIYTKYLFGKSSTGEQNNLSYGANLIFRYLKLEYDGSNSHYKTSIKSGNVNFTSSGDTANHSFNLQFTFARGRGYKHQISTRLNTSNSKNYINDVLSNVQSRTLSNLEISLLNNFYGELGSFFLKLTYTQGLKLFGSLEDKPNLPNTAPHAQFKAFSFYGLYTGVLPFSILFSSSISGQVINTEVYSQNQLGITGFYAVRGYETASAGSTGFINRNELSKQFGFVNVGTFLDYGYVKSPLFDADRISSYGFFIEIRHKNFRPKLTFASPMLNKMEEKAKIYFIMQVNI